MPRKGIASFSASTIENGNRKDLAKGARSRRLIERLKAARWKGSSRKIILENRGSTNE